MYDTFYLFCTCVRRRLYETVIHLSEINWQPLKNLLKCGFTRNLFRFSQENACTDFDKFFSLFYNPMVCVRRLWFT